MSQSGDFDDDKPRRGDGDRDREESSRSHRRQTRSRSPAPRRRSSRERSRSPVARRDRSRSPAPRRASSRSRSPSPRRHRDDDDDPRDSKYSRRDRRDGSSSRAYEPVVNSEARELAAAEAAKKSKKECRVYVGNLAFGVKWNDLKDFMKEAGTVVFSEIMMLPNGMSKGCGVVEYSTPDEAQKAIRELNDTSLMGRPLFIREDREEDARYGAAAISGRAGYTGPGAFAGPPRGGFAGGRGGFQPGFQGGFQQGGGFNGGFAAAPPGQGRHLYIQGLPFNVGWQDLKDLFRAAGSIIRADTKLNADGTPSGTGTVVYESPQDAQNAIAMYNGFEFQGNILEVREDRFGAPRGGGRGGFGGGFGGRGGFAGGFGGRGGFAGGFQQGGRQFGDVYADYAGPGAVIPGADPAAFHGGFNPGFQGGRGGFAGGFGAPRAFNSSYLGSTPGIVVPPSTQIFVKNLPWSTSNEDLVELFQTTGKVEEAEVLYDNGRSKGAGIVQFSTIEEAQTAIEKFQQYSYGGRPLTLEFNGRFKQFGGAADGPIDDAPRMEE